MFGAVVGSFLNVCIYRLPIGTSIVWPASACPNCHREIEWFENIPIVSWLVLRGRCRTCKHPIGVQYPIVEAITAVMFGAAWWYYGPGPLLASRLVFGCALIVLFAIDLEHHLLPNRDHPARHRRRLSVQLLHRTGMARLVDRHRGAAAAACC